MYIYHKGVFRTRSVKIINSYKLLTILGKRAILHVWEGSEYTSVVYSYLCRFLSIATDCKESPYANLQELVINKNQIFTHYICRYFHAIFSIWVFFHEHSRFTGQQGKWEAISNFSLPLLSTSQTLRAHLFTQVTAALELANLWFPSTSR